MNIALTIAGSDPSGGAGLQADLQVFRSFGVHGAGVLTALTVQDPSKVHQVLPIFPSVVLDQLRVLLRHQQPHAVKLGMLASDDVARSVALGLAELDAGVPVVVDPVLRASDGSDLLERRAWGTLRGLLDGTALVTPNLFEAEALTDRDVSTTRGTEEAARALVEELGTRAALIKGGHRDGPPDDLLARRTDSGVALEWLEGARIHGSPVHGTGCALASAIAAGLALGRELDVAVRDARHFVAEGIRKAFTADNGGRLLVHT